MLRTLTSAALVTLLTACPAPVVSPDAGAPDAGATETGRDAGAPDAGDPSALFPPDRLIEVRLELPTADWDTLRNQTRDLFTLLAGDCTAQPFPSPFTDFEGTATIEGVRLARTSMKKKGFLGSLSVNRPSLKLKFDAFLDDQAVHGMDAMTLNNAQQDPSIVRQCLGYALFTKAGLLAPRCSFAHVTVNGADLGVYAHVEAIDKDFLRRRGLDADGRLYEGTLSDFNLTFLRTFDLKGNDPSRADLEAVIAALAVPDAEVVARLDAVLDVNQFIDFWAMETLLRHWDGYAGNTNNFFLYGDPATGKFVFVPWGADAVFGQAPSTADNPEGLLLRGVLAQRLYSVPATRDRYLLRLRHFLDTVFDEAALRAELSRLERLLAPKLHAIQAAQLDAGLANVRAFITGRRAKLLAVLANPPAPMPTQRPSPCLAHLGSIQASFSTTWGTLGSNLPFTTGTGTYDLQLDDAGVPVAFVSSGAGLDTGGNDGPRVGVNVLALYGDGGVGATALRLVPALYPPSGPQPFDLFARVGIVFEFREQQVVPVGLLGNGTMRFTSASFTDGGVVSGSFDAQLYSWPFGG